LEYRKDDTVNLPTLIDSDLEVTKQVATLTFQRDDVRNALTGTSLVEDIIKTICWVNQCQDISVLILTGAGSAFCSGGNIKDMAEKQGVFSGSVLEIQEQYRRGIQQLPLALNKAEIPLIAAVNGPAVGAGLDLACMCDLRIGSSRARVGETFINLGLVPGDGGAWFLQRLVGYQRAAEMTLSGRLLDAREALEIGLFLEVVEPKELLPRAQRLAADIADRPPQALRLTKRLLKLAQRMELPDFLDLCASFQGMAHHTEEHSVAVNDFLEKAKQRKE
jgi:enoyl-CoA hydratase/carnithine racemase